MEFHISSIKGCQGELGVDPIAWKVVTVNNSNIKTVDIVGLIERGNKKNILISALNGD
ncbi:MAG: hypothetical protein HQL68_01315 [Magnetococcales bacterium]|nr:hypothetical protein [Magnetococcales bacterium]